MKLAVFILGQEVALLESMGDFKSLLAYLPGSSPESIVSLTMPARTKSYEWDDQLPPVFQMNLPEGYLLQVLQEAFGPHVGANPLALLSIVGRNMIGRMQVAVPGANLEQVPQPIDIADLLQGDNSEEAFAQLVRRYASSGVSGVVPKFLARGELSTSPKAMLITAGHIIKGCSAALPHIAFNEHFCMEVSRRVAPTAITQISQDGRALVVNRFDVDVDARPFYGMEDFCSLLGLRPSAKYETTWERISRALVAHIPPDARQETHHQLATTILLTYALRNADCHAKNLALLYTHRGDAKMAPIYDMLTTSVYEGYQHNPPAISFMGKKTWKPGKSLQNFLAQTCSVTPKCRRHALKLLAMP